MRYDRFFRRICRGLLFGAVAAFPGQAQAAVTALAGATVLDGSGAAPIADAVVIIEDGRIAGIGPAGRVNIPPGAQVHMLDGKWILPGLIDAHVHFFQSGGLYTRPDIIDLRHIRPYAREIATIRRQLPDTLARYTASGVTSVVDLAGPDWVYGLRGLSGELPAAPRVALSGPGLAPYLPPGLDGRDAPAIVVRTPEQARAGVRRLATRTPDVIKIWFEPAPGMELDEEFLWVQAAIDTAHAHGLRVAVHATRRELARRMLAAGADILVHGIDDRPVDGELLAQMRAGDVLYIPTLGVSRRYAEVLGRQLRLSAFERVRGDPAVIASLDDMDRLFPGQGRRSGLPDDRTARANLLRVHGAGIRVAAGSDAGNIGSLHGPALHRELELMVQAGLAPLQVLTAATRGGAAVMGRGDELGRLAAGYRADLLVLEDSPLVDIRNTRRIVLVMVGGRVVHCVASRLPEGCPDGS
ncbi:MAG: amidohydrolase family protein [Gammaproteobacteria bacterium]|jgi:imidazolonepropionase-like amidohydrolase